MIDIREEILLTKRRFGSKEWFGFPIESVKDAMDEYMRCCCLELLDYMLNNCVAVCLDNNNENRFLFKKEVITKEQLFENFL